MTTQSATEADKPAVISAYKGFDVNMRCRGFQFKVGETYTHAGPVELCESGFHACEEPFDCLNYYSLVDGKFAEVELAGVSDERDVDTKRVGSTITIRSMISIADLVEAQVEWCRLQTDKMSSGDYSKSASSGDGSTSACGTNGFASVAGLGGMVRGGVGSALSLGYMGADGELNIAVAKVGKNGIKPDTWYRVDKSGVFVEVVS